MKIKMSMAALAIVGALGLSACSAVTTTHDPDAVAEQPTPDYQGSADGDSHVSYPDGYGPGTGNDDVAEDDGGSDGALSDTVDKFGSVFEYTDGVKISVSKPRVYHPTEYAAGNEFKDNLKFTIKITNDSDEALDPLTFSEVTSGGQAASQVFDDNIDDYGPEGKILPGKSFKWVEVWSVADPDDIQFEIAPSFNYDDVIFTNAP